MEINPCGKGQQEQQTQVTLKKPMVVRLPKRRAAWWSAPAPGWALKVEEVSNVEY